MGKSRIIASTAMFALMQSSSIKKVWIIVPSESLIVRDTCLYSDYCPKLREKISYRSNFNFKADPN
jgi:hypothetical protein